MPIDRILNINDNETSRYALTRMLQHAGFEVHESETGMAGIEAATRIDPTAILLDIKLPDIDGFEVCRRLKRDALTARIPILHVTAHAVSSDQKVQSLEEGADAYLTFPVDRTYMVAMIRSLIRLRRAEEDREKSLSGLAEKNRELSEALDELRSERAIKEKFVATLSHDLRNPLAAIRLSAQSARRAIAKTEFVTAQLDRITQTTLRADQMIQDILDVGLLRTGQKLPLRRDAADLREIARETLEEFRGRFGADLRLESPDAIQANIFDPSAIRRILENLLQNAIKYGVRGDPITVSLVKFDERVILTVHNRGNPISPESLGGLFEPFTRGLGAKTIAQAGWGLGLTVVQGLVEAHQGSVQIESSESAGTRFIVDLPFVSASPPGLISPAENDRASQGTPPHVEPRIP